MTGHAPVAAGGEEGLPAAAFTVLSPRAVLASALTRGPWDPQHQHAGPPIAMVCRAIETIAQEHGLTHIGRLTANLLRPLPIGELEIEVVTDYSGRNAAHYSARLWGQGKERARFTALAQREAELVLPEAIDGHPLPQAPKTPVASVHRMPFGKRLAGYADLVENRIASGVLPRPLRRGSGCEAARRARGAERLPARGRGRRFGQRHLGRARLRALQLRQLRPDDQPAAAPARRVDLRRFLRTLLAPNGCGLAESQLFDEAGLIGRATQKASPCACAVELKAAGAVARISGIGFFRSGQPMRPMQNAANWRRPR
ncbi:MAG: thioesterase family protein [Rubrivivax sp.]